MGICDEIKSQKYKYILCQKKWTKSSAVLQFHLKKDPRLNEIWRTLWFSNPNANLSQYSSVNRSMYMILNKELEHSVCSKWNLGLFLKRIKSNFAGFLLWILSTFSNFKIILESPLRKTRECDPSDQGAGEGVWKKYKSNFHKNRNKRKMSWGKKAKVNLTLSERESNRFA